MSIRTRLPLVGIQPGSIQYPRSVKLVNQRMLSLTTIPTDHVVALVHVFGGPSSCTDPSSTRNPQKQSLLGSPS